MCDHNKSVCTNIHNGPLRSNKLWIIRLMSANYLIVCAYSHTLLCVSTVFGLLTIKLSGLYMWNTSARTTIHLISLYSIATISADFKFLAHARIHIVVMETTLKIHLDHWEVLQWNKIIVYVECKRYHLYKICGPANVNHLNN